MKYLISYWDGRDIKNRIIKDDNINSIEEAIQYHENDFGLEYYPVINVILLSNSFSSEIYDDL